MQKLKKTGFILLLFINLALITYCWILGSWVSLNAGLSGIIYAFGKLFGLWAVFFILLQFIAMGRVMWLEQTFGLDKLAKIHRFNGYLSIFFIVLHPLFLTISYAMDAQVSVVAQFFDFLNNYDDVAPAFLAVILFILVVFLSIYIVRKKMKYETWYYVHLVTYAAVVLAFGHQLGLGTDFIGNQFFVYYWYALYVFVFGNLVLFRFIKPLYNFWINRFTVSKIIQETTDTCSVYIDGKNIKNLKVKAGQFFILRFLSKDFWNQAHPFSLSCSPGNSYWRFTIKNCGDFTAAIPKLKPATPVLIHGPFGVFTPDVTSKAKYLFIAGGVGITPIRSIVEELSVSHDVILLYNSRNLQDTLFRKELDELASLYHFPIYYVMSEDPKFPGEKGRIDKDKFQRLVPDIISREIYICGPPPMIRSVNKILREDFSIKAHQIHYELFAL